MNEEKEYGYFAKKVAEQLGVKKDTLRSWALKLELQGVVFERNDRGDRIYYEKDVRALKEVREFLKKQRPMTEVVRTVSQKIEQGLYKHSEFQDNAEITSGVINTNPEEITQEKHLERIKVEFMTDIQDRFNTVVIEAVELAIQNERKQIAKEIAAQILMGMKNQSKTNGIEVEPAELEQTEPAETKEIEGEISGKHDEIVKNAEKSTFISIFKRFKKKKQG